MHGMGVSPVEWMVLMPIAFYCSKHKQSVLDECIACLNEEYEQALHDNHEAKYVDPRELEYEVHTVTTN